MSWNTRCAILFLLIVLGCCGAAFGATQNAVIYGTVYNAAGNPMPDVTVVLENRALGFTRTSATGSDGSYTFSEVPPADGYSVSAKQGARLLDKRDGITVNVGDERVILPPLAEQVQTATGETGKPTTAAKPKGAPAPTVRNEYPSTAVSGVVTGDQLRSLPLYNRNFLVLGLITPNVHDTEPGSPLTGASFSVAGARPSQNNFLLDGAENLASSSNQAIPFQVNDSIQEFRVTSSTGSAEYGRALGGTVNVVTKRASNAMHGSVYGYFGNDSLNADNALSLFNGTTFDKAAAYAGPLNATPVVSGLESFTPFSYNQFVANAQSKGFCTDNIIPAFIAGANPPNTCVGAGAGLNTLFDPQKILANNGQFRQPFQSYQFGGNVGGALIKDKWFAFGSYEGTRINNPNVNMERVPTGFDKTYDPYGTGTFGFANNDPNYVLGQNILGLFPTSNIGNLASDPNALTSGAVPGVLEFWQGQTPNYTNVHNFLFRTDYILSSKTNLSLRYVGQILDQLHDDTLPAVGNYPGNGAFRKAVNHNATIAIGHNFSTNIINETRFGYSRFDLGEAAQDASFDARTVGLPFAQMPTILLNGIDTQSSGASNGSLGAFGGWLDFTPGVAMYPWSDGRFPMARLGAPLGAPSERRDSTFSVANNVSWNHGHHGVKFGGEFRFLDNDLFSGAMNRGLVYSGNVGQFTSDSESCNVGGSLTIAGACLGNAFFAPSFDFAQFNPTYSGKFSSWVVAGYIQDTWRMHKNLTFNYGVRYEFFSVPREANDNIWNFDPTANGVVQQNGTAILDPYGNICGAASPAYGGATATNPLFGGGATVSAWNTGVPVGLNTGGCNAATSGGYNQIAKTNYKNFAPRFGVAWNVRGDEVAHPTVLRAGAGLFYDQAPISYVSQLMFNQPITSRNAVIGQTFSGDSTTPVAAPGCGGFFQCGLGSQVINNLADPNAAVFQPSAIYARDYARSDTPRSLQVSATVQQQLTSKMTMEVGYVGTFARRLPVLYDQNYAAEWGHVRTVAAGPDPTSNLFLDNMSNFPVYTMTNTAKSNYHSLMARFHTAGWHGLRLNAAYAWSRSLDNSSTGIYPTLPIATRNLLLSYQYLENSAVPPFVLLGNSAGPLVGIFADAAPVFPNIDFSTGALTTTGAGQVHVSPYVIPQDPFNFLRDDYGRSDFDATHRATVDYVWETKSSNKVFDMWTFSGIFTVQSGQPFSIFAGPIAGAINQRANLGVPSSQVTITDNPNAAIDPSQYVFLLNGGLCPVLMTANNASTFMPIPGQACAGFTGRNAFIGPNYMNMNFAVQKGFNVGGEEKKLYLRAEVFNVFDRSNFYNPISSVSDNGVAPSGDFGKIKSAHDPRQVQLAVRFSW